MALLGSFPRVVCWMTWQAHPTPWAAHNDVSFLSWVIEFISASCITHLLLPCLLAKSHLPLPEGALQRLCELAVLLPKAHAYSQSPAQASCLVYSHVCWLERAPGARQPGVGLSAVGVTSLGTVS